MQVLLVDPPEGTQVGPKYRAGAFTGVAMDFAMAITITITRPLELIPICGILCLR